MKKLNVSDKHRLRIAKDTLKMSDVGAKIMGGMDKNEARNFLLKIGWTIKQIQNLEK